MLEHYKFLLYVEEYAKAHPDAAPYISDAVSRGVSKAFAETRKQLGDMEVIASMALNTRLFKGNEVFIADKLESLSSKSCLRWDDQIKALRERVKK